jgi:hypothetical protein
MGQGERETGGGESRRAERFCASQKIRQLGWRDAEHTRALGEGGWKAVQLLDAVVLGLGLRGPAY